MKTIYSEPKFELVRFDSADIVATSGGGDTPDNLSSFSSFTTTNVESSTGFKKYANNIIDSFS